jgi:2-polyprenyl-3-methyl-5-hydroxy-6-metoxy-1,4-benzoquinol methylase
MQKNHREILYSKYHSNFNSVISKVDEKTLNSLYTHYDFKIFPHIKNYSKDSHILELGCGPGHLINYLRKKGFNNTLGIDISNEQIEIAKSKGHNVILADAIEFLKSSNRGYDIIFAFDFIEHFTKNELLEMTKLIYNILNDSGIFIVRTPNGQGVFGGTVIYGDLTHQTIFTPNSLTQLLLQAGFKKVECFENGPVNKNFKGIIRNIVWKSFKITLNIFRTAEIGGQIKILTQDFYGFSIK